jgi:cytochrome c biogenesis protein CcdA
MEKGIPLPELPGYEERIRNSNGRWSQIKLNPRWPLGIGAIFVMLGIGTTLALNLSHDHHRIWSFGLIPIFFGIGLFLHYYLTKKSA